MRQSKKLSLQIIVKGNPNAPSEIVQKPKRQMPVCSFYMRNQCTRGSQCRFHHPTPEKTQKTESVVVKKTKTDINFKNVKKPEVSFNWKRSQNTNVMEPPPTPPPSPEQSHQERKPRMVVIYRRFSTSPQTRGNFNTNNTFYY